jgi:uncharacterized protein (TIGR02271 family)
MTERNDRFEEAETFEGYEVYDRDGEKIGKVEDLFVNERDEPEYLGVQMGLFGLSGTTLLPWEICRRDDAQERIEVEAEKDRVKDAPSFDDDDTITSEYEREIHAYYDLNGLESSEERGAYGSYYSDEDDSDLEDRGEVRDDDELKVQRTEEELRAGTREREAGSVNVRKRVRTDREQVTVPKKREEVNVERVAVNEEAPDAEIIEDDEEIRVPVMEEEVVAEKKAVVKEEIRVDKDVAEDEEVVEEDVRKEEVWASLGRADTFALELAPIG